MPNNFQELTQMILAPLDTAIQQQLDFVEKNPSGEVQFIQSLRPLMGEHNQASLDETISLFNQAEALRRIVDQLSPCNENVVSNACVHSDGVYEVDENCRRRKTTPNMNDIFVMVLLLSMAG